MRATMNEIYMQHPRKADRLENVREWIGGRKADWVKPDGSRVTVEGTFALGASLSWVVYDGPVDSRGFQSGRYIVVCGHWQF